VATEIMLARERTTTGWMWAHVRLGPVRVMGLPVRLEIESPSKGSRAIGALILLLRIVGDHLNLLLASRRKVWLRGGGRR